MVKKFLGFWLVLFLVYGTLNYSGFCFREMRYLSDDEKNRLAAELVSSGKYNTNTSHYINKVSGKPDRWEKVSAYKSVDQFLMENPDCCTLVPKERGYHDDLTPPTFWERFSGKNSFCVLVKAHYRYLTGPIDEKGRERGGQEIQRSRHGCFDFGNYGDHCKNCGD